MRPLSIRLCLLFLLVYLSGVQASVLAPDAKLEKLAGDFAFTEGPTCDVAGNVYFTDQPNDRILKWDLEAGLSTFLQPSGRANGLHATPQGHLLSCADAYNQLQQVSAEGKVTVLLSAFEGHPFNGPNDLWLRADGALYFTDPYYKRPYWTRAQGAMTQQVYFLPAGSHTPRRVTDDLKQPNGIVGSPDGAHLYVADIGASKTFRYQIDKDGSLTAKTLFCDLGSDGMTLDNEGNLYLTGKGVSVFSSSGALLEHIRVPEPWTANVCIGGRERATLFITASKGLYAIRLRTRAANPHK